MSIGIPYARWNETFTARVCPECGAEVPEGPGDVTGEDTTNNYGAHYAKFHAELPDDPCPGTATGRT